MSFVVDSGQWQFDELSSDEVCSKIERFLQFVDVSKSRGERVWVGEELQSKHVFGTRDFWSLRDPNSPLQLPEDVWQELAAFFGAVSYYADGEWPEGFDGSPSSAENALHYEQCLDVAWVHHCIRDGKAMGCLSIGRRGIYQTQSSSGKVDVHWVTAESERLAFWRSAICVEGDDDDALIKFSTHAYPELYFADGALRGLGDLAGGYLALRASVKDTFCILNELGHWIFCEPPPALSPGEGGASASAKQPTSQLVQKRFAAAGLTVSPENQSVKRHVECRQAREITIGTHTLYCDWHVKLERHRNRIHIHPPIAESNNKVIVGIIHEHLPLP